MDNINPFDCKEILVSIIIRTKNEEKWISSCLRSVYKQSYKNIEVIIVDNESTDKTIYKAQEFPVKIINIKDFLPGKAINDGIRASSGDYIVCLSGHCIPVDNTWLSNLVEDLKNPNVAGVYGKQEPLSFTSDLDKRDLMIVFGKDKKIQVKDSFFHNANSAFRRNIWDKFPFDEELTNIEDRVWGELVISQGLNIIYEPNSSVYHWHGIHQDLSPERAKKIVQILEGIEGLQATEKYQSVNELKILAVIPIKGETANMNGRPLMERTIKSAKQSKFISNIVVATDNKKTASIAEGLDVLVPFIRPKELSEGYVDIFEVVQYTVEFFEEKKEHYDLVVLLEETYPFRPDGLIDSTIEELVFKGYDTILTGEIEDRSIWAKDSDKIKIIGGEKSILTPSVLKESKKIIGLLGLCCATYTASLRSNRVFSGNVGIKEVDEPLTFITARNHSELAIASIIENELINEK
jgi:rhamnosyltransferase